MIDLRKQVDWLLARIWFRVLFAAMLVALHVGDARDMAFTRFHQPFNRAPDATLRFVDPLHQTHVDNAKRLAVARWDAEHYIALALRGYSMCPIGPMTDADIKQRDGVCTLTFYPGYSMIGRAVTRVHDMPMDYALWYVTLLCTFLTFFLWTSKAMVERFGNLSVWFSLIALNAYGASCYLVFIGTEGCALLFTFASYLAITRRWYLAAALLAGAASAMRVSGVAASIAVCCAIFFETIARPPRDAMTWIERAVSIPLSAWGLLMTMRFFSQHFDDPMIYARAHKLIYNHSPSIDKMLDPQPAWIMHGLDNPMHDAVWVIGLVMWFLLGYKVAFKKLPTPERAYVLALVAFTLGISVYGSLDIHLLGLSRYAMLAFPLFIAVGVFLRDKPVVLLFWLVLCRWHYREADLCYYVGDIGVDGLIKCNMTQWVNW